MAKSTGNRHGSVSNSDGRWYIWATDIDADQTEGAPALLALRGDDTPQLQALVNNIQNAIDTFFAQAGVNGGGR